MATRSPFASRTAATLIALLSAGHALVASDLIFNYLPNEPAIAVLWQASPWVKGLWVVVSLLGVAAVMLLYRKPLSGFIASLALMAALYFASLGLWQELKGTFWIALFATALAASGAWVSRREEKSAGPRPLRDDA